MATLRSAGALTVNNNGAGTVITGDITSAGPLTVVNDGGTIGGIITGSGLNDSISILNGGTVAGGIVFGAGDDMFTIGTGTTYTGDVDLERATTRFRMMERSTAMCTAGAGDDTVTNTGTLTGDVALGDGDNSVDNRDSEWQSDRWQRRRYAGQQRDAQWRRPPRGRQQLGRQ